MSARVGEPRKFYENTVLTFRGEECLVWPYARFSNGYGRLNGDARSKIVSRLACEDVNGLPPSPSHQAAHSCGNGHLGCVNPQHLSWKTAVDNSADRIGHGTVPWGHKHGKSKLTEQQVAEIISLRGLERQSALAKRFGVSQQAIGKIQLGMTWSFLRCPTLEAMREQARRQGPQAR